MIVPRLAALGLLAVLAFLVFHFLLDPHWHPPHVHSRARGKGAAIVALVLLVLSLPVWARVPIALTAIGEAMVYNIAMLLWTLDTRPDFAIGPQGVYGVDYLTYRHISWRMIDHVLITRSENKFTGHTRSRVCFVGKKWDEQKPGVAAKARAPKLLVLPYANTQSGDILEIAKRLHPSLRIIERHINE